MALGRNLRGLLNRLLKLRGYQLLPSWYSDEFTLRSALGRVVPHCDIPGTIVDVGASNGHWAKAVCPWFPNARYLLIEANPIHEPALRSLTAIRPNFQYALAAASDRTGLIYFDASDPVGGLASWTRQPGFIQIPATTIDAEVARRGLLGPYVLKLDTHGFEVPILQGATATLGQACLLIVETYNFHVTADSLLFWEMCEFLHARGFRPIDLCESLHRPKDAALWEIDFLFLPSGALPFASDRYD